MNGSALTLTEIYKELSMIPEENLNEVKNFISIILAQRRIRKRSVVHLEGIWAGKGLEGLSLKKELKTIRKEVSKSILKRGM